MSVSNDSYGSAVPLSGDSGSIAGTNIGANTLDSGEVDGSVVWYKWTAPRDCQAKFWLTSPPKTAMMRIFNGSGSSFSNVLQYADYRYGGYQDGTGLFFDAKAGEEYHISVGTQSADASAQYAFTLNWQVITLLPLESPASTPPANSDWTTAIDIDGIFGEVTGTTNGSPDNSVWYKWTPDTAGTIVFTVTPTNNGNVGGPWAYRGDAYASSYDIEPAEWTYGYDFSTIKVPAMVGIPLHINVSMFDVGRQGFKMTWKQLQPQQDPVSGLSFTAMMSPTRSAYVSISNPLVNEVWVMQDIYAPTTPTPYNAIARFREGDGLFLGFIQMNVVPYDPIVYDAFNQRVWIPLEGNQTTYVSALPPFTQGPVFNFHMDYGGDISPVDGTLWLTRPIVGTPAAITTLEQWSQNTGTRLHDFRQDGITNNIFEYHFSKTGRLFGNLQKYRGDLPYPQVDDLYAGYDRAIYEFNTTTGAATRLAGTDHVYRFVVSFKRNSLFLYMLLPDPATGLTDTTRSQVIEYSLDTNAVVATYEIPYYFFQYEYYGYIVADDLRDVFWIMDTNTGQFAAVSMVDGTVSHVATSPGGSGSMMVSPDGLWVLSYDVFYKIQTLRVAPEGPINDRDVWLESYANRFENSEDQDKTSLSGAQSASTGIVVFSAKRLDLAASVQFFIVRPS